MLIHYMCQFVMKKERVAAISQVVWASEETKDFSIFGA